MNKIWEFFENMNEFLYVSDMDTYEIVYMNKKSLDAFGISSIDEIKNKKCHEILQNCYTPCSLCKNKDLRPGEFIEWTYYNPAINKHLSLKDTMVKDGEKKYRITLAIEKTDFEPQSNKINNYQDMCAIVNEGIKLAGYTDYLTKLGNRHAMNDYIQNYMPDNQSIGIIYCDITGLKQVNDTEGHAAGDKLILDACACMKRVFKHNTLFRIGGDEFLYLCPNITEDKLKQLEQKLKDDISKHSVNMAIGRCWCENSSHNLDKAISQAEKAMYQDKLDYYDKQGR